MHKAAPATLSVRDNGRGRAMKKSGQRTAPDSSAVPTSFDVALTFAPRVIAEHFGKHKYATSTRALGELVANAFDAGATWVDVSVHENDLGGIETITVVDNGRGMTSETLRERFGVVGVGGQTEPGRLGRFGIGRLGVFRVGSVSTWVTVSKGPNRQKRRLTFTLRTDNPDKFSVREESCASDEPTGTHIEIHNVFDSGAERPTEARVLWDLAAQFCSFLLGNTERAIRINGKTLDLDNIVSSREREVLSAAEYSLPADAAIDHLLLKSAVEASRFPAQLLFAARGVTVQTGQLEEAPDPNYLGIVSSPFLDDNVASGRDAFVLLDNGFASLSQAVTGRVREFSHRLRETAKDRFIERARQSKAYPFRGAPADAVVEMEQTLFDRLLELLHVSTNLDNLSKKQQDLVFGLLHRSLGNEHMLEVLGKVAALSDDEMKDFREVLERTTLQSIIRLASEVTERLVFLDVLHDLVYGTDAKHLRERSQLHKLLEPNCWIFGPQFHLATSDQSFRSVIKRHRELADLPAADEVEISAIKGVQDIPDLFLAARREFPVPEPERSCHHVIVELKRPSVKIGGNEVQQINRYGTTLTQSQQFDRLRTQWDIFVVSSEVSTDVDLLRKQRLRPEGCIADADGLRLWALSWGEIIQKAKSEMRLVREHLKLKSQELSGSEYLRKHFPDALQRSVEATHDLPQSGSSTPAPPSP
jgi:hypothetical protein